MTTSQLGRPFNFPDPRNVTVGNPTFLASKELVVAIYNQANPTTQVTNYCQRAKEWFIAEAFASGWSDALETGNGLGILLHLQLNIPQIQQQQVLLPKNI
jgi:hypothetical protein